MVHHCYLLKQMMIPFFVNLGFLGQQLFELRTGGANLTLNIFNEYLLHF